MKSKPAPRPPKHPPASPTRGNKKYLIDAPVFAPRFARLMQSLQDTPKTISHQQCQDLLEFYIDSEERHENVRALYPLVWEHLQTCEHCQAIHALMTTPPDSSIQIPAKLNLPFLTPANPTALWNKQIRPRVGGAPLGFNFVIQATHLARALASPATLVLRDDNSSAGKSLILSDLISLPEQDIAVDVWLYRPEHQDTLTIEISAVASTPFATPMQVALAWNQHRYTGLLREGHCIFDSIPLSEFQTHRDLSVEFEAQPASHSNEA